jgi:hypothetical protein
VGTATALPDATATRAAQCRSALATPGIFRTDCESSELSELRGRVEAAYASRRKLDLASLTRSRHAAAGLVKLYLRELPRGDRLDFDRRLQAARHQKLQHHRSAMRLQFQHVFTGIRMRRREIQHQAVIQGATLVIQEYNMTRVSGS